MVASPENDQRPIPVARERKRETERKNVQLVGVQEKGSKLVVGKRCVLKQISPGHSHNKCTRNDKWAPLEGK